MSQATRISYGIMAVILIITGVFHLGTLVLTAVFGYFALEQLSVRRSKLLAVILYLLAVIGIGWGLVVFSKRAYRALPEIANQTIPAVIGYAEKNHVELPFSDYASLKAVAMEAAGNRLTNLGHYVREAVFKLVLLVIGVVVSLSLFLNARWDADDPLTARDSLYGSVVRELVLRFETFYQSFAKVIGAQIVISAVNTALTSVFLFWNHFSYTLVLIGLTFLCGLLPIIGNIISNTLIVGVAFAIPGNGPRMALIALIFLIVIHKLEYFLNSKIIGSRIKNPMWLTLIGIVIGEKLMGVPGMILAPVVLHYIKVEASRNKLRDTPVVSVQ